jgi:hypothetical protein
LYLIKGIKELDAEHNRAIKFTGCQTDSGKAVDAVSSDHPIRACISKDDISKGLYVKLLKGSPDLQKLKATFQRFLNTVREAIGLSSPVMIPDSDYKPDGSLPQEYDRIASRASIIEMIADLGPPLPQIFPSGDRAHLMQSGKVAVQRGVNSLGIRFFTSEPSPLSDKVSVIPVNYMMSRP